MQISYRKVLRAKRDIYTLNPKNVCNYKPIELSNIASPTVRVFDAKSQNFRSVVLAMQCRGRAWPPNTKGYFYYATPAQGRPRIAGELRLRIMSPSHPFDFEHGTDFYLKYGLQRWHRPLYSLATNSSLHPLFDKILSEDLVSSSLAENIKSLSKFIFMYSRCQRLHTLSDPFEIDLASEWHTLVAITEEVIKPIHLRRIFMDARLEKMPYKGKILAAFEPNSSGPRTVYLRILSHLSPIQCTLSSYDEYIPPPIPGTLFTRHFRKKLRPWNFDIDKRYTLKGFQDMKDGLSILWNASAV